MPTIALVDDDKNILASVSMLLEQEGYTVRTFSDGVSALTGLTGAPPDLAILDIKMPRMDGLELLRRLKQGGDLPVIFLTSKDEEIDELMGLNAGADDYIRKPFSQRLLLERVRAVLRRAESHKGGAASGEAKKEALVRGKLALDPQRHECTWEGKPVRLTVTEFLILQALAQRPGFVKSRDNLMDAAYDDQVYVDDRTIDSHIKRLRKKFKVVADDFDAIETLYGVGYRYKENPEVQMPGEPKRRRFSALTVRIVLFNTIALVFLIAGVLYVRSNSAGLVDERIKGIHEQASIVAGTLAEYATDEDTHALKTDDAESLLRQLISPTKLRGRLYDTHGQLVIDSRELLPRNVVQVSELPPIDFWGQTRVTVERVYDGIMGVRPFARLAPYLEGGRNGKIYSEVDTALEGNPASAERVDEQNRLILSVAMPVERFRAIYGVLLLSTEGGDIDGILRQERATLIELFLVALAVMIGTSLFLAGTIARPIQKLAAAAERVRKGRAGREQMPLPESDDEIGELSESLGAMTQALYDRIDAIESFAADVAHELKNPLTSLTSAVEMLGRAKDDAGRERMMEIVRNDVKRIDRLITDISDASRLDAELSREASAPIDLAHLLETLVEVYGLTGLPRGVTLKLDLNLPPGATVIGMDERLGQIFRNLVDNAVSFSPDNAAVHIAARAENGRARVTVEDEGEGIPAENLETIFNRFYTERPAEHGFGKNSGLGLSIARQIAAGLGGRIWAENCDMGGARFLVELPLASTA